MHRTPNGRHTRCTAHPEHSSDYFGCALSRGTDLEPSSWGFAAFSQNPVKTILFTKISNNNYRKQTATFQDSYGGQSTAFKTRHRRPFWPAQAAGCGVRLPDLAVGFFHGRFLVPSRRRRGLAVSHTHLGTATKARVSLLWNISDI